MSYMYNIYSLEVTAIKNNMLVTVQKWFLKPIETVANNFIDNIVASYYTCEQTL